ncbi:RNA-directed DNA polymerase, eukaryota, reverse transcriptase zinc-binding domain protein [Tanacetum coccineum]
MGDGAWQEVTTNYKKRRSVFDRLGNTTNVSKEDEIQKISTFVFITNFPNQFTAKDLWNTCKQYGQIVDAYIPNRRSKAGKRFGFLRFIKSPRVLKSPIRDNVGVSTWFSQMQQVSYDFSIDGRVTWVEIEGITLKLWSENTFKRVALKWGVLLDMDDKEDECFHKGKVVWVRAKEVPGWVPNFVEDDEEENELDEEFEDVDTNAVELKNIIELEGDSDEDAVPETKFREAIKNLFPLGS